MAKVSGQDGVVTVDGSVDCAGGAETSAGVDFTSHRPVNPRPAVRLRLNVRGNAFTGPSLIGAGPGSPAEESVEATYNQADEPMTLQPFTFYGRRAPGSRDHKDAIVAARTRWGADRSRDTGSVTAVPAGRSPASGSR